MLFFIFLSVSESLISYLNYFDLNGHGNDQPISPQKVLFLSNLVSRDARLLLAFVCIVMIVNSS